MLSFLFQNFKNFNRKLSTSMTIMFSYSILKHINKVAKILVRHKNPPHHWSVLRKKDHPVDKALDHFDDFYKQIFDKKWPSIRKALFDKQKYVAVVNYFSDNKETIAKLELEGALNMRKLFSLEKQYIQEEVNKRKRNKALNKIFKMESVENSSGIEEKLEDSVSNREFSLASSLDKAEYDTERLVDSRSALSSEILHHFIPATKIKGKEDYVPESSHYEFYDQSAHFTVNSIKEYDIHFPEHLDIYCFEEYNQSDFENPLRGSTGVFNYYLMDGGSVLPVLALDIKPGNKVLDMCASPGGKSLLAIQTLYPECVVSNDVSHSRMNRVQSVCKQFLYDFKEKWLDPGKVRLTNRDARNIDEDDYDRILVDVPCTTDRHSLHENDNNIFKPSRIKERLQLPELQKELLFHALKLVSRGGIVVYSTCSLSPIQNDGVVHMALKQIWEETKIKVVVKDLSPALLQTRRVYEFADRNLLRYGHLVIPCLSHNYGPTYFCKLQRVD